MDIVTLTCPECGTIIAGNVLAAERRMLCPGLNCDHEFRFGDLSPTYREATLNHLAE